MNSQSNLFKPFTVPTQINNIGVLILAYVINQTNQQTQCHDQRHIPFLHFILYGSIVVYGFTFLFTILYMIGIIDTCINRMTLCGEVFLTINALGIFAFGIIYHFIAMLYGVYQLFFETESICLQLEIFRKVNGLIYTVWLVVGIGYIFYKCTQRRPHSLHEHLVPL